MLEVKTPLSKLTHTHTIICTHLSVTLTQVQRFFLIPKVAKVFKKFSLHTCDSIHLPFTQTYSGFQESKLPKIKNKLGLMTHFKLPF